MPTDDPIKPAQDPDATMLVLNPGGRRPASPAPAPASAAPVHVPVAGSGLNRLVQAANPLLDLVVPLRHTVQPPDLAQLRERLALAIRTFENDAQAAGAPAETVAAARYALCTLLDETIAGTAWGSGVWGARSLLVAFHNEASGGEKFFLVLQRLCQEPAKHIDLLELMYLCLALGLEGRFRLAPDGPAQLTLLRERLAALIGQQRGPLESDLSPHWRGEAASAVSPLRSTPVWVMAAVACVLLLSAHLVASQLLARASDPVYARLSALRQANAPPVAAPVPVPARVAAFLAPEVAAGLVTVQETASSTTIVVRGDGMFGSGSAEVNQNVMGLLERIGDALQTLPGKVRVIGYTDSSRPGLSARYPSNYELSSARAAAVQAALASRAGPASRYSVEGRGDYPAVADNASPAGRARNRRVELVVLTPAGAP
ncbi:type IVB secretion system protein IcmH/DotU [Massilia sp. S19_KUP03_FR1]|uniref:type IVB secretion system protein IcmH/DotU n=1 Tax=Massilia sp. S19_KUP03_FR1 TaxID=3025503 RepID=UPI002FCD9CAF